MIDYSDGQFIKNSPYANFLDNTKKCANHELMHSQEIKFAQTYVSGVIWTLC